jgi:hypothetical protein
VHELEFGDVAIAGTMLNCVNVCAFETGAGEKALVYQ